MEEKKFIIIKGLIDGHDKKQATVYGAFLGVVTSSGVKYVSCLFSFLPISRDMSWSELLELLREERAPVRDITLTHMESQLENFLNSNKLMLSTAKSMNGKELERSVSFFCGKDLSLRTVTLVEISSAYNENLSSLLSKREKPENEEITESDAAEEESADGEPQDAEEEPASNMLSVSCDPVFDPVSGVAVTDLRVGVAIVCRLSENSVYYQLFANRFPDFDGSVTGEVTGIKINEYGTAVVGLSLAEGISGAMKLSSSVRVRLADKESYLRKDTHSWLQQANGAGLPLGFLFGAGTILLLLCLIGVLVYFFS